ncbi:MAG: polyprenyl synthetase family protein [Candidatus Aureabacteria bacterium]|nr:polyprenyl synthetase family protein [Candidatus Auribacterota bacterium]
MDFKEILNKKKGLINQALEKYLPERSPYPQSLTEAMRYSLFAGGKRIRPVLCMESCRLFSSDETDVLPCACAMEMIHTYSLIHDDLPCMDDDDFRRGNPTCHKKYGEALALLAGDALLTLAFHLLTKLQSKNAMRVINEVSDLVGGGGLIGGQVADLQGEKEGGDREKSLHYIHLNKTAKLIIASVRSGALIGGAGRTDVLNLTVFAENLGYAFQISDDILDVTGSKEELGKSPGKDKEQDKLTFPSLYGLERSREILCQKINAAVEILKPYGKKAAFLYALTKYVGERKS